LHQQTRSNGEGKSARQKDRSRCSISAWHLARNCRATPGEQACLEP